MSSSVAREVNRKGARVRGAASARETISRHLGRIIFYALLAVIFLAAIPYGTVDPWSEAVFECVVFALGGLWVIEGLLSGSWLRAGHSLLIPVLALVAFALFQTLPLWAGSVGAGIEDTGRQAISADPYGTRFAALKLVAYILTLGMLLRYTESRRRLRALVFLVLTVAVLSALFGIARQSMQREPGFILPRLMPGGGYGQFINYNHFALLMEMALGLTLGFIMERGVRREWKLIHLALALPVWAALVLSTSRGGILGMLALVVFIALMWIGQLPGREAANEMSSFRGRLIRLSRSFFARTAVTLCLVVIVFMGAVWMTGDRLVNRIGAGDEVSAEGIGGRDGSRRMEIWRATWQIIKDHPLAGVGLGSYWVVIDQYLDTSGKVKPYEAHNDYLDLLASVGLIGAALAAWFAFGVIRRARENLRSADPFRRAACVGACAGLFGVAVHSLVDFGLQITINALIFIALITIAAATIPLKAEQERDFQEARG